MKSINKHYLILFIGIILLALSIFVTIDWNFWAWMTLFLVSIVLCTLGIVLPIVHLFKQIQADRHKQN